LLEDFGVVRVCLGERLECGECRSIVPGCAQLGNLIEGVGSLFLRAAATR
jgi:hypothetical protein